MNNINLYLIGSAGLFAMMIVFSLRYHSKRFVSYVIAISIAVFGIGISRMWTGHEYDYIYFGVFLFGAIYGALFGQKVSRNNGDGTADFKLQSVDGKTIYFGDPKDNFLIYAGANAGKTKSIGKPLLSQFIKNGWAGFIMDYKDWDYSKTAYNLVKKYNYQHSYYHINFTNLSTSSRCNIIKPEVLKSDTLLIQMMQDLLSAYMQDGKKDEWFMGGLGVLKGVALRFFKDYPKHCTVPHIINFIIHNDRRRLEEFLRARPESKALATGFLDSSDSERTQASILSSLTNYIGDLAFSKEIAYVLSGDDFDFNIIDPQEPKLLSVANNYAIDSIISPVISMMVTISSRAFSMQNKQPCVYFFDEATTARIRDFEKMPSVLREYLCSIVLLTQSASKLEKLYGRLDRSSIEANFSNLFLGRTKDIEALKNYVHLFSKKEEERRTHTRGHTSRSDSRSVSVSKSKEVRYEPDFFMRLQAGEFVGSAAHSNYGEFHLRFKQYDAGQEVDLPIVRMVLPKDVENNYQEIIEFVKTVE